MGTRRAELVLHVVVVVVLAWVLWVTAAAEAAKVAAASGRGHPGVMAIEGLRPSRGSDIPVGSFTDRDGTSTVGVAWQDRPARVGDRKEGVRVGTRAWAPGVRLGWWDVLVLTAVVGVFGWRLLLLVGHLHGRGGQPPGVGRTGAGGVVS